MNTKLISQLLVCGFVALSAPIVFAQAKEMPPGLWQATSKMDIPNMPPEMAAKMGGGIKFNLCVLPGESRKWTDQMERGPMSRGDRQCEPSELKTEGSKTSWKFACADGTSGEGSVTMNGKDAYTMNTTIVSQRGSMKVAVDGKRIAETCDKSQSGIVRPQ
jgi:hypothetical protein